MRLDTSHPCKHGQPYCSLVAKSGKAKRILQCLGTRKTRFEFTELYFMVTNTTIPAHNESLMQCLSALSCCEMIETMVTKDGRLKIWLKPAPEDLVEFLLGD